VQTWEGMAGDESLWHIQLRQAPQRSHFILQDETTSAKPEGCWSQQHKESLDGYGGSSSSISSSSSGSSSSSSIASSNSSQA